MSDIYKSVAVDTLVDSMLELAKILRIVKINLILKPPRFGA